MKKVEILAPAGSYESLIGAIHGGCDAVYLGGTSFGARAYANNLEEETMLRAIDYVHLHNKKIYLTVNTLLHNEEIEASLFAYLKNYYTQGLDAVIVQDVGVMSFLHENFPKLPIHASTQMTLTGANGVKILEPYGVTRFVTSRELGLEEIKSIRKNTKLEIEAFVHGALCYCYSGQCFMSSMLGNRSGNRGRCAQPCRMPYQLQASSECQTEKKHLKSNELAPYMLSPKDMCTLNKIPELIEAGIDSFKIEGRMKRPEYSAFTAKLYRKYVDLYLALGKKDYEIYMQKHKKEFEYDYQCLMDLYNRGGFSSGYYENYNGKTLMSMKRPNHSGVLVGKVTRVNEHKAAFQLVEDIFAQDILEFRDKLGNSIYEYTVKKDSLGKEQKTEVETNYKKGSKIRVGDFVYRTRRNTLLDYIQKEVIEKEPKLKLQAYFYAAVGEPIELTLVLQEHSITAKGAVVSQAQKQPMTKENIQKQLSKLKETSFQLENLEITLQGEVFIPVGQLNDLRRTAILQLTDQIGEAYKREEVLEHFSGLHDKLEKDRNTNNRTGICVSITSLQQFHCVLKQEEIDTIYFSIEDENEEALIRAVEQAKQRKKEVYLILPTILREKDFFIYKEALQNTSDRSALARLLQHKDLSGFLIKNYEEYQLFAEAKPQKKELILDFNMYTFNRWAKAFWHSLGVYHTTASLELNSKELKQNECFDQDIIVYGHLPLMTSTQCITKNTGHCLGQANTLRLKDHLQRTFYAVNHCKYCYNVLYQGQPLSLHSYIEEIKNLAPRNIRLHFTIETAAETEEILDYYLSLFQTQKEDSFPCPITDFTTGHFKKGVK